MKALITKSFPFSPDGTRVEHIEAGQVVEGRAAEAALQSGWGEVVAESKAEAPPPAEEKHEEKHHEKSLEAAPHNKAAPRAPHRRKI